MPKQQIHRDLHYGNLLFEGTTLTGVLDFDLGKQVP
ncbi:MAG: phosphotransferase [Prevotella sp.]|nr:phosphotransferase [Prevotella sp.]MDR1773006.1 phosphotransferase [Hungatella sp.]